MQNVSGRRDEQLTVDGDVIPLLVTWIRVVAVEHDAAHPQNRLTPQRLELLAELQSDKLELAPIVVSSGGGPLHELEIVNQVRANLEREFLVANAAAFEALKLGNS